MLVAATALLPFAAQEQALLPPRDPSPSGGEQQRAQAASSVHAEAVSIGGVALGDSSSPWIGVCVTGMMRRLQPAWLYRGLVDANPSHDFHIFYVLEDSPIAFSTLSDQAFESTFQAHDETTAAIDKLVAARPNVRYSISWWDAKSVDEWRKWGAPLNKSEYGVETEARVLNMYDKQVGHTLPYRSTAR